MFLYLYNKVKQYLGLADDILVDFLSDIKSLRYQLVLAGFAFNVYLFSHGADKTVMLGAIGLLTSVYAMYFYSKHKQAQMESNAAPTEVDGDPDSVNRDPDNI